MQYVNKRFCVKLFFLLCSYSGAALSGEFYYDLNLLNRSKGSSANLKVSKMDATLNVEGIYRVEIYVNEKSIGYEDIAFKHINNDFTPELSTDLINKIGFNRDINNIIKKDNIVYFNQLKDKLAGFIYSVFIDKGKMLVSIPSSYLRYPDETFPEEWDYGMNTFFTSYNYSGYNNSNYQNAVSKYQFLSLYNGINVSEWQLRNKSFYNKDNNSSSFHADQTWLSRDFGDFNSRFTIGQTQSSGLLSTTFRFDGVKLESIPDMRPSFMNGYLPEIFGNALSNATVKVFQGNNLVYQTFVNPGPFNLSDIPISGNTDLRIQVTEEDGSVHEEFIPISSVSTLRRKSVLDYSISIGKYNIAKSDFNQNNIISADFLYGLTGYSTLLSGATLSDNHHNFILGGGFNFGEFGAASIISSNSVNQLYNKKGNTLELRHFKKIPSVSTQFDFRHKVFSGDYSDISDNIQSTSFRSRKSTTSFSLNQPTDNLGSFRFSAYMNRFHDERYDTTTYSFNWSAFFYGTFLTLSSSRAEYLNSNYKNENVYNFNVSIPFGSKSTGYLPSNIKYNYSEGNNYTTNSLTLDKKFLDNKAYINASHSISRSSDTKTITNGLSGFYFSDYSRISAGLVKRSDGYEQKNWRLSGSLVAHSYGVTLSPNLISGNGASTLVTVPGASGVSITNNFSSTDYFGNVLVNNLRPYKKIKSQFTLMDFLLTLK